MAEQILALKKSNTSYKMIIPKNVEAQIRHLCSVIHDVEWSGVLFYKKTGSIETNDLVITCIDICIMDIGSATYTRFIDSPDVITYRVENNLLEEGIYEALIHSHNSMATFFSGTDQSTLVKEGSISNHFVSLIVNNEGTYTAALTRKVTTETTAEIHTKYTIDKHYNTFNDEKVELKKGEIREDDKTLSSKSQYVEWFDLIIEKEEADNTFVYLDERLGELRRRKNRSAVSFWDDNYSNYKGETPIPTLNDRIKNKTTPPSTSLCLVESFDPELIKTLSLQLLTGSIIINNDTINPVKWVNKMDNIYKKRFGEFDETESPDGEITSNNEKLKEWIESMCDFLVYTEDEKLLARLNVDGKNYDRYDTADICATGMYEYLQDLPYSYVKELMCNQLLIYIPEDVKEYLMA